MLLSAVSFLVFAQSSSEVPEGLMNNPVYCCSTCFVVNVGEISIASGYMQHQCYILLCFPLSTGIYSVCFYCSLGMFIHKGLFIGLLKYTPK